MQALLEEPRTAQQWKRLFADERGVVTVLNLLPYENPVRLLGRSAVGNFIAVRRLPRCREASLSAVRSSHSSECNHRILVDLSHLPALSSPIVSRVLNYTQRVDPDVVDFERASYGYSILECPREHIPFNHLLELLKKMFSCPKRLYTSPAMTETGVFECFLLGLVEPNIPAGEVCGL